MKIFSMISNLLWLFGYTKEKKFPAEHVAEAGGVDRGRREVNLRERADWTNKGREKMVKSQVCN